MKQVFSRARVVIEDYFFTIPLPGYQTKFNADAGAIRKGLHELNEQGYTSVPSILDQEKLRALSVMIDKAIQGHVSDVKVSWSDRVKYWRILNPLRLDPVLCEIGTNPLVISLVERFFGRYPYIADVDMRRIPPTKMHLLEPQGYSSSNWHRDTRGRQLKMMVYLTDVGPEDSNFAFLPSTHIKAYRRKKTYEESRLSDEVVARMNGTINEWHGAAGDSMIFDSNLIHRLRRKPGSRIRDSVTFYYTPGQSMVHLDVSDECLGYLPAHVRAMFAPPAWPFKRMKYS